MKSEISVCSDPVEAVEARLLDLPQADIPLTHRFAPGVYMRQVLMPAGTFVIGHQHKTEHLNIVLTGRARVMMLKPSKENSELTSTETLQPHSLSPSNGEGGVIIHDIVAPCTFVSQPGVRKILYILEDMQWATIHPTTETELDRLEELLITKSNAFLDHQAMVAIEHLSHATSFIVSQPSTFNHL